MEMLKPSTNITNTYHMFYILKKKFNVHKVQKLMIKNQMNALKRY
jgi:hypothetical protein